MSDRFGTRAVVLIGGVLLGAGLAGASQADTLLQFQLLFGVAVGLAAGAFYAPLTATTTRWFTEHRSLAVALVSAGLALGDDRDGAARALDHPQPRLALRAARLCRHRLGCHPAGGCCCASRPRRARPEAAADAGVTRMTVAQALRTPQFAAIALAFFMCCAAHSGPIFHMVSYAVDCGVPAMAAATVFSVAGLSALSGRIICGLVADRVGAKRTLVAGLALQAVAVSLYLFASNLGSFYAVAALFGFSYGGVMPLYAILVREYFPAAIMGSVFGVVAMISTLGMAFGPWTGGWLFDTFGSYVWLYIGSCGIGLGAVAIATTMRPPRLCAGDPAEPGDCVTVM